MHTAIIIFARLDSQRLPGKALLNLQDRAMLGRVIDRLRCVKTPARLILATSNRAVDNSLADFAEKENIEIFRGSCDDVLQRAYDCFNFFQCDRFVRICGDSPFLDWRLVDVLLQKQQEIKVDLVTNIFPRSFPPGNSIEILSKECLEKLHQLARAPEDREHLTRYIYGHSDVFSYFNYAVPDNRYQNLRLVVDTEEDFRRADWLMEQLGPAPETATFETIMHFARKAALIDFFAQTKGAA